MGMYRCVVKSLVEMDTPVIVYDLDDSRLRRLQPDLPCTSLHQGVEETVAAFRRLQEAGRLDLSDLAT